MVVKIAPTNRSALSSFRKEFFTPFGTTTKPTVGRTSCGSNDGFQTIGFLSINNFIITLSKPYQSPSQRQK